MHRIPQRLRRTPLLIALGLATIAASAIAAPPPPPPNDGTLLNISAQAEARHAPDIASLSAGVTSQAADGKAAMADNARKMERLLEAIRGAGIADRDVRTSGIRLGPQYHYEQNKPPRVTGYQASNTVELTVRDITRLGALLDTLAAQGATEINGPSFEIENPEPIYDQARGEALKKAQARAQTYARTLDLRVRRIVSISEGRGGGIRPLPMLRAAAMKDSAETSVQPGENTVSVDLDVVFELGR